MARKKGGGAFEGGLIPQCTICQWNSFNDVYLVSRFDVSSFSVLKIYTEPAWSFLLTLDRSQLFYWVWVRHITKNDSDHLRLIKIQEPHAHKIFHSHFQWSNKWESRTGFFSKYASKAQSFISFCNTILATK